MSMSLPTGTVTFLFTDIEGSTKLAQEHPAEMPALLARHNEILNQTVQAHNGHVFQIVGDSFAVAFHSASDGLNAALDAQRALQSESWNPAPIIVRMGIHTGAAQLNEDNQYAGYATIASTQRIMSAGHGGQILISGATRELVRNVLPAETELLDLGEKRLKDLLRPEHLYQLNISGLPTTFPPLKTLDSFPNNLPSQLTSFIGRENEIAEVKQELETHRLVTLTGSGGTGKTRLSLQVAAELLDHFGHGVWSVELAPLTDPDLIPQVILSAIGVQEQPGKTPIDVLKVYLHEKQALIVLDNCEHLIEASAKLVNTLLNAAPKLKILASSREALGVKGEASYPVPSLSAPPNFRSLRDFGSVEQLSQYEAVRLFIDRALLVAPHFVVDADNAPYIAKICYRLDGIPLAIELAAARIKMMSVDQISKRLDDRFRLLTGGARTALPRQQTLRGLIDWSYDLLTDKERLLLQRLSIFAGGWTLEAAEEVCNDQSPVNREQTDHRLPITDILDLLTQLFNKSLVVGMAEGSHSGETRYRMLETIRQYAREKLLEAGSIEIVRDKHLAYFVKLAEQAEPELYHSNQAFWLNKLDEEMDNFRMAVEWAIAKDVESGLRIAAIPWRFWLVRGYLPEVADWLEQLLEQYKITNALHAQALAFHSLCKFRRGDFSETIALAKQSLEMARTLLDKQTEALSLAFLGILLAAQGNVGEGTPLLEEALAIYRSLDDKIGQAQTTEWLAINNNDIEYAIAYTKEGLALARELGDLSGIAARLCLLSRLTWWKGDLSSPAIWLEEALSISRQIGNHTFECEALLYYGVLSYWQGDYQQANVYYQEAIMLGEKIGDTFQGLWSHIFIAYATLRQGEIQKAQALFEGSVRNTHKAGFTTALVFAMEGIASLHVIQNQPARAAQLFAWADAMRDQIGNHRPPVEQASVERDLAIICSKVNDAEFIELSEKGRTMTVEQAIAYALTEEHR